MIAWQAKCKRPDDCPTCQRIRELIRAAMDELRARPELGELTLTADN